MKASFVASKHNKNTHFHKQAKQISFYHARLKKNAMRISDETEGAECAEIYPLIAISDKFLFVISTPFQSEKS